MRIAIITNVFPAVSETFISNKVKALAARGHAVTVFCTEKNDALFSQLFNDETGIAVVRLSAGGALIFGVQKPTYLVKSMRVANSKKYLYQSYATQKIIEQNPDIVHFEFSGIGIAYLTLLHKIKGRKVVSCRGSAEKVKLLVDENRKQQFKKLTASVDAVHCVSADMQQTILGFVDKGKTFVNYPSVDTAFFHRAQPYSTDGSPIVLSVGRFTFQKGYLTGLLAMRRLAAAGIRFTWVIVGAGPQYEEIRFHIRQLQLDEFVQLAGSKNAVEIKNLLEQSAVFLLTSVYEGIANAALEAMSMEVPVVSTACGGMPEVITCGKNGLLAPVYEHEKLAAHLQYLLQHPEDAKRMGILGRERILEAFTLTQQTDQYEAMYQKLING